MTVTQAANRLYWTPPTVSAALRRLTMAVGLTPPFSYARDAIVTR
jgi:hypothetical protein